MREFDLVVIGSGIGGSLIASLNKDKNIALFEKDSNLGGCASSFKRFGNFYNTGATTFVGYENNHIVKKIFDEVDFTPDISESKLAIKVLQNKNVINRSDDFEKFLENINRVYPNDNNRVFWEKIREIDEKFWRLKDVHFAKHSIKSLFKSFTTFIKLFRAFGFELFYSAEYFVKKTLGNISKEYKDFINSQLLITVQTKIENVSFLSMALGLAYPFHKVYYANGGMGEIIKGLLKEVEVYKNEEILNIESVNSGFYLKTSKGYYYAKKIVLNSTIYDSGKLFSNKKIKNYYDKFKFSDQSAFVTYMTIDTKIEFNEHYQIILEKDIPNAISNSFFISFSKQDDEKMSKKGLSITISTHTKAKLWESLTKEEYEKRKSETQEFILNEFLKYFDNIKKEEIIKCFSGTSKTFNSFIGRLNCGGKAINVKSILQTPSCTTPFDGIFNVGDTIFAGQGWPGVALGASVLNRELNEKL